VRTELAEAGPLASEGPVASEARGGLARREAEVSRQLAPGDIEATALRNAIARASDTSPTDPGPSPLPGVMAAPRLDSTAQRHSWLLLSR
jgi:hypothetical protein